MFPSTIRTGRKKHEPMNPARLVSADSGEFRSVKAQLKHHHVHVDLNPQAASQTAGVHGMRKRGCCKRRKARPGVREVFPTKCSASVYRYTEQIQ